MIRVVFFCSLVLFNDFSVIFLQQVFMNCAPERCLYIFIASFQAQTKTTMTRRRNIWKKIDHRVWVNNGFCYDICGVWYYGLVLRCKMVNTRLYFLSHTLTHSLYLFRISFSPIESSVFFSLPFNWTFTINNLRSDLFRSQRLIDTRRFKSFKWMKIACKIETIITMFVWTEITI